MELQREPPAYQSHDPTELLLPSVPQSDISIPQSPASDITLPDLRSVLGDLPTKTVHPKALISAVNSQQLQNYHDALLPNGNRTASRPDLSPRSRVPRSSIESLVSPSDTASVMSFEEQSQRSTSVSLEDPDVRLAAEALSGLGQSGRAHSSIPHAHATDFSQVTEDHRIPIRIQLKKARWPRKMVLRLNPCYIYYLEDTLGSAVRSMDP